MGAALNAIDVLLQWHLGHYEPNHPTTENYYKLRLVWLTFKMVA